MQAPWRTCSGSPYMDHEFSCDSSPASAVPADVLTSNSSDFLEHTPLLNFKWPCSGSWNPKQSSPFTNSPLKDILTLPPTLRTARNISFFFLCLLAIEESSNDSFVSNHSLPALHKTKRHSGRTWSFSIWMCQCSSSPETPPIRKQILPSRISKPYSWIDVSVTIPVMDA